MDYNENAAMDFGIAQFFIIVITEDNFWWFSRKGEAKLKNNPIMLCYGLSKGKEKERKFRIWTSVDNQSVTEYWHSF